MVYSGSKKLLSKYLKMYWSWSRSQEVRKPEGCKVRVLAQWHREAGVWPKTWKINTGSPSEQMVGKSAGTHVWKSHKYRGHRPGWNVFGEAISGIIIQPSNLTWSMIIETNNFSASQCPYQNINIITIQLCRLIKKINWVHILKALKSWHWLEVLCKCYQTMVLFPGQGGGFWASYGEVWPERTE